MARVKKFYDYEYDRILTEESARKYYQRFVDLGYTSKSFEEFAKDNFCDLSDPTEKATAQSLHDSCGWYHPVCTWSTLMRKAV